MPCDTAEPDAGGGVVGTDSELFEFARLRETSATVNERSELDIRDRMGDSKSDRARDVARSIECEECLGTLQRERPDGDETLLRNGKICLLVLVVAISGIGGRVDLFGQGRSSAAERGHRRSLDGHATWPVGVIPAFLTAKRVKLPSLSKGSSGL